LLCYFRFILFTHRCVPAMFERQIEETIVLLRQQTIGTDDAIQLRAILSSPIPDSVKRFFTLEAERWREQELKRLTDSSHFDYSEPEIKMRFEEITRASRELSRFTAQEFTGILEHSVKLLFNYVCRPQWTLTKYVFADTGTAPAQNALDAMEHFPDYTHYRVVMREYFRAKGINTIGREKFEELLALIDNEIVRNLDSSGLARMAAPIFALFNPNDASEFVRVPVEALSIFYDDKDVSSVVDRLELEKQKVATLSMHELIMLVGETDFTAGLEIGVIVTKHVIGGEKPAEREAQDIPVPDIDFPQDDDEASQFIEPGEADFVDTELPIPDETLPFIDESDSPEQIIEQPEPLSAEFDDEPVAGEQETPDFSLFEEDETPVESAPVTAADIPEGVFITSEEIGARENVADELAQSIPQAKLKSAEDDDFLKNLNLTEEDFLMPEEKQKPEEALPELNLDDLTELPDERSEISAYGPAKDVSESAIVESMLGRDEEDAAVIDPARVVAVLGDLNQTIPASDKRKFVKKLFSRKEHIYQEAIDTLNGKATWREASEYIDEIFLDNNIDMYSRIAVNFTDEIYKRYQKKKS